MSVISLSDAGLRRLREELRADRAIVIPFESPLPYALAARSLATLNEVKGRPSDQPSGILVADLDVLERWLTLQADAFRMVRWIGEHDRPNLLLPLNSGAPAWLVGCAKDGWVGVSVGCLEAIRPLVTSFGHLHISSCNRTGRAETLTARSSNAEFSGALCVLDGDASRDSSDDQGSAAIVQASSDGVLTLRREGINNRRLGQSGEEYVRHLRLRAQAGLHAQTQAP